MATPYDYPAQDEERSPRFTIMSWIAIAFAVFMVIQVADTIGEAQDELEAREVKVGHTIEYHYVARLPDGTLFETSRMDIAEEAARTSGYELRPAASYQSQTATIDPATPGLQWGEVADRAVVGVRAGKSVTFTVPPQTGTGEWETFFSDSGIPRDISQRPFQRVVFFQEPDHMTNESRRFAEPISFAELNQTLGEYSEGYIFNSGQEFPPAWDIRFEEIDWSNRSLLVRHLVEDGQFFDLPTLPGGVTVELRNNESQAVFRLDLEEGKTFVVRQGTDYARFGFNAGSYFVEEQTEDSVRLLYHPGTDPSAVGQPLEVTLSILRTSPPEEGN